MKSRNIQLMAVVILAAMSSVACSRNSDDDTAVPGANAAPSATAAAPAPSSTASGSAR